MAILPAKAKPTAWQQQVTKDKSLSDQYKPTVVMFLNWRDDPTPKYNKHMILTQTKLYTIKPDEISCWMQFKVYGKADPDVNDMPTEGRLSSLEFVKKTISHFMPDKLQSWNIRRQKGNPIRLMAVNNLIKLVKRKEVRHQGKKSQARTPFTEKEYKYLMACLESHPNLSKRFFGSTIIKYQYIMGARIDDSSKALGTYNTKMFSPVSLFRFSLSLTYTIIFFLSHRL